MALSLLRPVGYNCSTCGYCSPPGQRSSRKSSRSYGMVAPSMSPSFYQGLIDRGWRRSGEYVYHPDMRDTCCPQYTIRLDAGAFSPTKNQRGVVNRFNRFLQTGHKPGEGGDEAAGTQGGGGKAKGKGKGKAKPFDLVEELRLHQVGYATGESKHKFELEFVPAVASDETFALYKRYQMAVHNDGPGKNSMTSFSRFLCDSPLGDEAITYSDGADTAHLPQHYGSYHLLYRVDGKLVGISVIDVLPACVSSVYFIWDPDWAWAALGKLSALFEIALVREMAAAGAEGMKWLYMGYWIADCAKMRYKGEYAPSFLLDPGTQQFHLLTSKLDTFLQSHKGYIGFTDVEAMSAEAVNAAKAAAPAVNGSGEASQSHDVSMEEKGEWADEDEDSEDDESEDDDAEYPTPPPPGMLDPATLSAELLGSLVVFTDTGSGLGLVPYAMFKRRLRPAGRRMTTELVAAVGPELLASIKNRQFEEKGLLFFG
ncbi:Arginyl-tRNA--protein transferase 1 [Vanrija pseudolonga]|uniref:arginyltransferase n=1 Tax=Vanrija pseudolonga TaxID=143232 RepID=A0AAF0Y5K9_9TREE|nr:Arginyl-tRNA--protein transferase 1 [Vanrija pseudolonga]